MKDSEVLILCCPPPFYPQLASRSLLSVALLGCLPSLDAAVCVMRLHGLFFGTMRNDGKYDRFCPFPSAQGARGQTAGQSLSARTKFASANSIFSLAVCFRRPRYRVFRYRNCPFMTANTCSTFALTDDF